MTLRLLPGMRSDFAHAWIMTLRLLPGTRSVCFSRTDHGVAFAAQHAQHMCHGGDISVELMGHCMRGGTAGQGGSAGVRGDRCLHLPAVHIVEDHGGHLIAKGLKEFPAGIKQKAPYRANVIKCF